MNIYSTIKTLNESIDNRYIKDFTNFANTSLDEDFRNAVFSDMKKLGEKYLVKPQGPVSGYSNTDISGYTKCYITVEFNDISASVYYKDAFHCRVIYSGKVNKEVLSFLNDLSSIVGGE